MALPTCGSQAIPANTITQVTFNGEALGSSPRYLVIKNRKANSANFYIALQTTAPTVGTLTASTDNGLELTPGESQVIQLSGSTKLYAFSTTAQRIDYAINAKIE